MVKRLEDFDDEVSKAKHGAKTGRNRMGGAHAKPGGKKGGGGDPEESGGPTRIAPKGKGGPKLPRVGKPGQPIHKKISGTHNAIRNKGRKK